MNKYKRLGKNTLLVFIGNAGSKLIGLVMLPFYTSWLSVEDYGVTDIINVYVSFLVSIVSCCIAESRYYLSKRGESGEAKAIFLQGICFGYQVFSFLSLFVLDVRFCFFHIWFLNSFTDYLWLIYGLMAATLLQQFFQQFTRSIDKMIVYGMAGYLLTLLTAICSFILIPLKGVVGYVLSLILANLFTGVYSFFFSGKLQILFTG